MKIKLNWIYKIVIHLISLSLGNVMLQRLFITNSIRPEANPINSGPSSNCSYM